MIKSKRIKNEPKLSNKTLASLFAILAIIVVVWLVGYFTGIDEGKSRSADITLQKETNNTETKKALLPNLPQLPHISEKSATSKLPELPELP